MRQGSAAGGCGIPGGGLSACRLDFSSQGDLATSLLSHQPLELRRTRGPFAGGEAGAAWAHPRSPMSTERQLSEVRFLTVAEVASIMRVSKMTVYRLVHGGELPAVRVGRSFRVPEDAVHTYLSTSFVDTA